MDLLGGYQTKVENPCLNPWGWKMIPVWASVPGNAMEPPDGPFRGTVVEVIEDKSWDWGLPRYLVKFDEEIVFSNHGRLWLDPEFV